MSSRIDKRIKNARLAIDRASNPEAQLKAQKALATALRLKDEWKVTRR